jgi:hypothetical protein
VKTPLKDANGLARAGRSFLKGKNNKLIMMMERFEVQLDPHREVAEFYDKLHTEILQFRDSVKDILNDMQPIKEIIIEKISAVIRK